MKAVFSSYLNSIAPGIKKFIAILKERYDYVSVLSTDSNGFALQVSQHSRSVSHRTMMTERGNVARVYKDGLYSEYAFNDFDPLHPEITAQMAIKSLDEQLALLKMTNTSIYRTDILPDNKDILFAEMETGEMPEDTDMDSLIELMTNLSNQGMELSKNIVDCRLTAQSTHVCKIFLSTNRDMRQSYVYSEGNIIPIGVKNGRTEYTYSGISGRKGPELFRQFPDHLEEAIKVMDELLDAEPIMPGEYDVITSPEVSGLIAHEAFGHGVEMDMFVKDRALGAKYINKRVGSDLVTMHEGANAGVEVASYAFDDEGNLAQDTIEIQNGILKTGVCDALSALRLGVSPTGNGKRENFEHKVYTRMTNTIFDSGRDNVNDMIASISHGYLLCGMHSGMEDPKHWGIQCIVERGYEIKDGKLTGKVVTPVVMTGYVPDLLGSISMLSGESELFGTGGCGKGHKEWVKVSDGGPYMKARARLG